jgi:hypothetical protein
MDVYQFTEADVSDVAGENLQWKDKSITLSPII